jgi:hypothetical protein
MDPVRDPFTRPVEPPEGPEQSLVCSQRTSRMTLTSFRLSRPSLHAPLPATR